MLEITAHDEASWNIKIKIPQFTEKKNWLQGACSKLAFHFMLG